MATIEELERALRNADAAGDANAARILAGAITKMRQKVNTPQNHSDMLSQVRTASGGVLEGIPVVGPMIRGGVERAAAATLAPFSDMTYGQVLDRIQETSAAEKAANPVTDTVSQIAGAVGGTVPMVMAAPAAFGAGAGALRARTAASMASGGGLGGADAAVRSGGDINDTAWGAGAGLGMGAAGPFVGKAIGTGAQKVMNALANRSAARAAGTSGKAMGELADLAASDALDAATMRYTVRPDDHFGLADAIRDAVEQWITAGNVVSPYVPPTAEEIRASMPPLTRRQFRLGMASIGLTKTVIDQHTAGIADEAERETAQIEWEEAGQFERLHPLVVSISAAMDLAPETIDQLWQEYALV